MDKMNILVLGSGGREHAIAWKISKSPKCDELFIAPGNAGTEQVGKNVNLSLSDFDSIAQFILEHKVDMLVVGPEAPLVDGICDFFQNKDAFKDLLIIGPDQAGAVLEGSKDFAKEFMAQYQIPTARYKTFNSSNIDEAFAFLEELQAPYVLKADGLAAGKGVLILDKLEDAKRELQSMLLDAKFGEASKQVVIEEFLSGIEMSVFVLTDGKDYLILPEAKDYKRIGEGDTGLNTGGMGAVSPVPFADKTLMQKIEERIIKPSIHGLSDRKFNYKGFLFIGLMIVNKEPFVIEYNVRMGDPETEVVMPRIKSDLLELLESCGKGELANKSIAFEEEVACTVMLVSGGYPEAYEKGKVINGLDQVQESLVFHAGTKRENGKVLSAGGRVLTLSSMGNSRSEALKKSYNSASMIDFEGKYYRSDIGLDLN